MDRKDNEMDLQFVYVVVDSDYRDIYGIYDENGIKKEYSKFILNPPLYSNHDYWDGYDVYKYNINSEESQYIDAEDIRALINKDGTTQNDKI